MFSKNFVLLLVPALVLPIFSAASLDAADPAIQKIAGVNPMPNAFEDSSRNKPLVLGSAKSAGKYFAGKSLDSLKENVDFENQYVLVFAWRGSGQDRLEYAVQESFPEQVVFSYKPGRTRDLRPHVYIFALRSNVKWKTATTSGGGADHPEDGDYIQVEIRGTLNTQVFAIGGETTGVTITANGITWDLSIPPGSALRKKAENHHQKTVLVTGRLTMKQGVERGPRYIVNVDTLEGAAGKKSDLKPSRRDK